MTLCLVGGDGSAPLVCITVAWRVDLATTPYKRASLKEQHDILCLSWASETRDNLTGLSLVNRAGSRAVDHGFQSGPFCGPPLHQPTRGTRQGAG